MDNQKAGLQSPPEAQPSAEQLFPLDGKYTVIRFIGKGRNDKGYLVKTSDGKEAVALTPIGRQKLDWDKTIFKSNQITKLDAIGLKDNIAHEIERGTLHIDGPGRPEKPVVIYEHAGEMIETLKSDQDRLDALLQIKMVLDRLHECEYSVNDFKPEHWLVKKEDGKVRVRLIDPMQIRKVLKDANGEIDKKTDHRDLDHNAFIPEITALFPWANEWRFPNFGQQDGFKGVVEDLLSQIEQGIDKLGEVDKFGKKIWYGLKRIRK